MAIEDRFREGEEVKITDSVSIYYGQIGIVDHEASMGGLYIKHKDGKIVLHPYGWERVRKD